MGDMRKDRGNETRHQLLMGALELVGEEGLQGLTAGKLAQRVGVSKSTIFHHFSSLEQVPLEAMKLWVAMLMQPVEEVAYKDLESYLAALGSAVLSGTGSEEEKHFYRASMAFFHKSLCDEVYRAYFSEFLTGYLDKVEQVLSDLTGLAVGSEKLVVSRALLGGLLDGLAMHKALLGEGVAYGAAWSQLSLMLVDFLAEAKR